MVDLAAFPAVYEAGHPTRMLLAEVVADCVDGDGAAALMVEQTVWALVHRIASLTAESEIRFEDGPSEAAEFTDGALDLLIRGIRSHEA